MLAAVQIPSSSFVMHLVVCHRLFAGTRIIQYHKKLSPKNTEEDDIVRIILPISKELFLVPSDNRLFFNCFPPKIGPLGARFVPIHHGPITNHMLTVP
jgi:hypothetical protein